MTDTFYKSPILDCALQKGRTEIVRALVAKGVPVSPRQLNMVVGGGDVPTLQAAISATKVEAAAILRKAGAVLNRFRDFACFSRGITGCGHLFTGYYRAATVRERSPHEKNQQFTRWFLK